MGIDLITGKNGSQVYVCTECHEHFPRREAALVHRIAHSDEAFAQRAREQKAKEAYEAGVAFIDLLKLQAELAPPAPPTRPDQT